MKKELICKYFAQVVVGIATCIFGVTPGASAAVNVGSSSWVWQNPLPQGNNLQGVTCSSAGDSLNCIAVGDLGTILFGTASGGSAISWTNRISNTSQTLWAVACVPGSLNSCIAVGDGGTILATWDQGTTWTSRSSGTTARLTGISCSTTGTTVNCFAVGGGSILTSNDDGVTWGPPQPAGAALFAVSCPDANTCYAAGNSGSAPTILKTTNRGATWTSTVFAGYSGSLTGISCGSASYCVAVDTAGKSHATTDGINWAHVVVGAAALGLHAVSCWDAADCVAVGGGAQPNLYWTNNTGATWHSETSGADSAVLQGVNCSGSICLAVGQVGEIVTNYPLGTAYTNLKTTVTSGQLRRVSCVDINNCWAVGDGGIFATNDGGTTWANKYSTSGLSAINCPSATTCFAVGGDLVLDTTDGGKTWSGQSVSQAAALSAISCPGTSTCFAGGEGVIVATTDGKTWLPKLTFPGTVIVSGIVCTSTTSCIAVGSQGVIFTTFNGNSWTQVPPLTGSNLQDVSCTSASICLAVGDSGTTLITTDGGKNWSLPPSSTAKGLTGVGCNLDLGCYATTGDGYILQLFPAIQLEAALWNQEAQQETSLSGVSCVGVSGEYRCVAVGDGGTIISKQIGPSVPDFSLDLQVLSTGKFGVRGFNVIVRALGSFNGTVTLSCNIPGGQSCTLNPISVVGSGTSLMTGPTFLPDWDGVTVTATSGSLKHTATFVNNLPQPPPCKPEPCQ